MSVLTIGNIVNIFTELRQIKSEGCGYFTEGWNWIDMLSCAFCSVFIVMMNMCIYDETLEFKPEIIRTVAALACFIMWIKCFYWMRLFESFAHFITLITQTIYDI